MTVTAGNYTARATAATLVQSPKKGTPGVSVSFRIVSECGCKGESINWEGWLTPDTKARTAAALVLMGFDGTDLGTCNRKDVALVIEDEEWTDDQGEMHTSPKVKWVNDPARGGARFEELPQAQRVTMMAELRGIVLAMRPPTAAQHRKAEFREPPKPEDFDFGHNKKDEIPF